MGRPIKIKRVDESGEKAARKKPRYHPGTVRTRQKIRNAVRAESVVPMAFFRRAILEASGGEVRWTKNAVIALKAIVEARVHRTLALGSTLARVARKKTLNNVRPPSCLPALSPLAILDCSCALVRSVPSDHSGAFTDSVCRVIWTLQMRLSRGLGRTRVAVTSITVRFYFSYPLDPTACPWY